MTALVIVVVLVLLSITVVTAVAASLRFPADAAAFRCKLRPAPVGGRPDPWPRRRCRATWVHDVLLVRRGVLPARLVTLPVRTPEDPVRTTLEREVRGLGTGPVAVVLRLDDGRLVEVAVPRHARTYLVGPFLAAAVPGLPRRPRGRRNLER
jgi:hypothetical protein